MYSSLKDLMNIPFSIKPFIKRTATDSKTYGDLIPGLCYAEGKIVAVKNALGNEVVSNKQLYIDGSVSPKATDLMLFEGIEYSITAINTFYDGGVPSLRVVYL